MDILRRHEIFEIEVLESLKNGDLLRPLVFTGGTMLRLCYELNRYSTDLDFWFIKKVDEKGYFNKIKDYLVSRYEITDAQMKFNTLLVELRSPNYPKRLKIEIRKGCKECESQERIAFSKYGTSQVILRAATLDEAMKNKIKAALDRNDVRDFFDIEFLLRQGVKLDCGNKDLLTLKAVIAGFKERDYKVALGSLLDVDTRKYYVANKFDYILRKIGI